MLRNSALNKCKPCRMDDPCSREQVHLERPFESMIRIGLYTNDYLSPVQGELHLIQFNHDVMLMCIAFL
ncbi:hypothetical protein KM043_002215 [Ampulex compressa]|nr:hypothetical protein KM043_002215 [Ampulex compressa]